MSRKKLCNPRDRAIKDIDSCECEEAGWCPLFNVTMGPTLHRKCQSDKAFRESYYGMRQAMESDPKVLEARKARKKRQAEADKVDLAIESLKSQGVSLEQIEEILGVGVSKGLGDTITNTLSKFGITPKLVEKIMGSKGCGCNERKDWLNKIFPYKKKNT
tara:strand:+ start:8308 stop:8787 length:480 start_codon:yes stop_codon:yes gene_type:complete